MPAAVFPRSRFRFSTSFWTLALSLIFSQIARSEELRFKNGDRLTGKVLSHENGVIRFQTDLLGVVSVPEANATVVDTPDTPVESLAGLPPSAPPEPTVKPAPKAPVQKAAAPTRTASAAPDPSRWKGKIEAGFQQQSGRNETVDLSLRGEAERKIARDQYRFTGRVLYGEKNEAVSSDRSDASFRWRREFSERIFSQALTTYLRDQVKSIDLSAEQNIGIGYRFLDRRQHVLNAGIGATGRYRDATGTTEPWQLLGEFFEDYTYKINGRFTFLQNALLQWSAADPGPLIQGRQNYKLRFESTLQGKVTERLSMNLRFEHEFDNAIVNREARTDQRITSSLGFAF